MTSHHLEGVLIIPHLRVQNANAISSPMTWGFPSITAFTGLMQALERKLPGHIKLQFEEVGVVCHAFDPQTTTGGYTRAFHLTRNPVGRDGSTSAIVEEGRAHLEISLVFGLIGPLILEDEVTRSNAVEEITAILAGMRIAGGSVLPLVNQTSAGKQKAQIIPIADDAESWEKQFRALRRRLLPGFVLTSRQDLLERHLEELRKDDSQASSLDAWLNLSRLTYACEVSVELDKRSGQSKEIIKWEPQRPPGWIVPIPVGYGALSEVYPPGAVLRARDQTTPFRFVETLYSIGEWVSPHRLKSLSDLFWYVEADVGLGIYQCVNTYGHDRRSA